MSWDRIYVLKYVLESPRWVFKYVLASHRWVLNYVFESHKWVLKYVLESPRWVFKYVWNHTDECSNMSWNHTDECSNMSWYPTDEYSNMSWNHTNECSNMSWIHTDECSNILGITQKNIQALSSYILPLNVVYAQIKVGKVTLSNINFHFMGEQKVKCNSKSLFSYLHCITILHCNPYKTVHVPQHALLLHYMCVLHIFFNLKV